MLNEISTVRDHENPVMEVKDGSIEFDHVTFRYSDSSEKPVLDDIDLKIESGMTVGIVGGTGSAKSSLVQLVPRLYDVSKGSLKVGGVDVRDYDLVTLRDQVAMVLQKNICSPVPSPKTCVGATRRHRRGDPPRLPARAGRRPSSRSSRRSTIRTSNRVAPTSPVVSASVCASPAPY